MVFKQKGQSHIPWHTWAVGSPQGSEEFLPREYGAEFPYTPLSLPQAIPKALLRLPAFSSAMAHLYFPASCVNFGSVTSQMFVTPFQSKTGSNVMTPRCHTHTFCDMSLWFALKYVTHSIWVLCLLSFQICVCYSKPLAYLKTLH